ncbi:SRPBCC family protein [Snuella sedimenti]|uniref:SRPBCC family protein n=1 Tax=Snuella sedimenti TaxID=2798802 RepID=A0A8J7IPG7_9FLAO|nr:SRPBCC family protein [Snuella sedimenti]MBJ6368532.1 SRPBCC family protein [Snuella sedimenti]
MPIVQIKTEINSDIKTCFDLARNIDLHQESLKHSNEKAIAGKVTGLIKQGEWVSWEAKHVGFVQHLTSKIVEFNEPNYFVGEMVFGAFKWFRHEYHFYESANKTLIVGKFHFESPYGILGKLANFLFLRRYMEKLLKTRIYFLKAVAESS